MSVTIRRIVPDEWGVWKKIRLEALEANPEAFGSSLEEESEMSDEEFSRRLTNNVIYGAWIEKELVGTVGFMVMQSAKMRHRGRIFGMYVRRNARGKGVSKSLVEAVINYARSVVAQVHCTVVVGNTVALRLYESHGFKIYGTEPKSLKVGNRYCDEYLMVRSFL